MIVADQHGVPSQFQGGILLQRRGNATRTTIKIFQCSIGSIGMRACELGVTLKNFDVCTVIMDVACPLLQRSIIIHPWHYPYTLVGMVALGL